MVAAAAAAVAAAADAAVAAGAAEAAGVVEAHPWRRSPPIIIITNHHHEVPRDICSSPSPMLISSSGVSRLDAFTSGGSREPPLVDDERDRPGKRQRPRVDERLQEPTGAVGADAVALRCQAPRRARVERLEGRGDAGRRELARGAGARPDAPRRSVPVGPPRSGIVAERRGVAAVGAGHEVADDPGAPSNPAADVDAGLDAPRQRGDGRQDPQRLPDGGARVEALLRRMGGNERERRAERRGDRLCPG